MKIIILWVLVVKGWSTNGGGSVGFREEEN